MPRKPSSRKFQLTINNPTSHGFTHSKLKVLLSEFSGCIYWCMCDETGENGTPHTHVYVAFKNDVMFDTIQKRFYGAHVEMAKGKHTENRDYVRKEGKWSESEKKETNHPETFEEWGDLPDDRTKAESQAERIVLMIRDGKSNDEIISECPTAYSKLSYIEQTRQSFLQEEFKEKWRDLDVTYLWGSAGVGKTRSVMEQYGYSKVYRVTDYAHPFDSYKGQDVIVFEEFRSSLPISDMLNYLDGYPVELPCRYANKVACYTKVYLISNIPFNEQYPNVKMDSPETYEAWKRRIHHVIQKDNNFALLPDDPDFNADEIFPGVV